MNMNMNAKKKQKKTMKTDNYIDQNVQNEMNKSMRVCLSLGLRLCVCLPACMCGVRSHAKFLFQWSLSEQSNEQHQQQ